MTLTIASTHRLFSAAQKRQLADALGDCPESALPVHLLRKGGGQVYLAGDLPDFRAVIIEDYSVGPELMAFGNDVYGFREMLGEMEGWDAVNAPDAVARELAEIMRCDLRRPNHIVDDVYQVPGGAVAVIPNEDVRMLTRADIGLLEAAPDDIRDGLDDDLDAVLDEEVLAGAVLPGAGIVALASTYGFREPFVDLAISTLAQYRCRGYARAAASLIAAETQRAGRVPIWSCAPTNMGSLQVAYRLGFREVSRRANIVVDREE